MYNLGDPPGSPRCKIPPTTPKASATAKAIGDAAAANTAFAGGRHNVVVGAAPESPPKAEAEAEAEAERES